MPAFAGMAQSVGYAKVRIFGSRAHDGLRRLDEIVA
jgi:hypothetical protein